MEDDLNLISNENNNQVNNSYDLNNLEYKPNTKKYNTLNETIKDSIMRDILKIKFKIQNLLLDKKVDEKEIREYELWGPFLFTLILSIIISLGNYNNIEMVFTTVFMVIIFGSIIITLNCKLLKLNITFFQSISIIGYSIFPFSAGVLLQLIIPSIISKLVEIFCCLIAFYLGNKQFNLIVDKEKKILVKFPLFLFYSLLGLFILNN